MLELKGMVVVIIAFMLLAFGLLYENKKLIVNINDTTRRPLYIDYILIILFFWVVGV